MNWLTRQFNRLLRWLRRRFDRKRRASSPLPVPTDQAYIQQNSQGDRNQTIAQMSGGTAIANVENLIQNFHLSPQEVLALESFWQNWSQDTNPPLSPSLVIGGREKARDRIVSWLQGNPSPLSLQADSPEEAIAFLAAVVQNLDDEKRTEVLSRAVIVDGVTSWQSLITSLNPLILIARLNQREGIGQAVRNGHHVFIPLERSGSTDESLLPRIVRDEAEQALKDMGLSYDQARNLATLARRSLSALRRKLAIAQNIQRPEWAQSNNARDLLAPLLASAWDDSCKGDRDAVAQLSGIPYENLQTILVRWVDAPDPPIRRVGNIWMIAAQEDAWRLIARYLTDDDLQRFETVAIDILSELDPAFELLPEQRSAASIYGKVLTRSGHLRKNIAEAIALMAARSSEVSFTANRTGESVARSIVRQLMENAKNDNALWASLASELPLLAEAAPSIFLEAVHAGLAGESPSLVNLFQDSTSDAAFMSSSPYTSLLWALETLAWHPNYLGSVALCLAQLTRLDPGGRLCNRPAHSLRDIFICCHPHTTAPLASRLNVLDTIRRQEPEVAWHLLMNLLPTHHTSIVLPTHGTKWRDWVPDSPTATGQEYFEATTAILNRLLSDAGTSSTRWCSLIAAMAGMTSEQQETVLQRLETLDPAQFSSQERAEIFDCLRQETTRHRRFPEAGWAMPVDRVEQLEGIYNRFQPDDLIDRYRWLFKLRVELPGTRDRPWNEQERAVENLRVTALQEILTTQGWNGVLNLARQVQKPALVGHTLAEAELLPIDLGSFLEDTLGASEGWRSLMIQQFVRVSAYKYGESWVEDCLNANLSAWSSEEYGEFLLCLPFNVYLLDRLDAAVEEVQHYFWSQTQARNLLDANQAERVLTQLLKFQRPHFAVDLIEWAIKQTPGILSPERIAEVLEISARTHPDQRFNSSDFVYHSAELLDYLENTEISRDRLASLELSYFQIHQHERYPRFLYKELSRDPALFIEALQHVFRAKNEPPVEISDEPNGFAELMYSFLHSWKQMPGVQEDSSVDADALRAWVMGARELAAECDRSERADIHIGYALAFSPIDPDGIWPHKAVRDLIQEMANLNIEKGWRTQIFDNRGVTTRSLTEGGKQEFALVERYETAARQLTDLWPRVAAILQEVAEGYRQDATRYDQRAELTQDFWR